MNLFIEQLQYKGEAFIARVNKYIFMMMIVHITIVIVMCNNTPTVDGTTIVLYIKWLCLILLICMVEMI